MRRQLPARHVGPDAVGDLVQHGPGVHPGVHLHDRHAGRFVAADDGPLDRRRAAQAGQQGRMHIHHAARRQRQQLGLENVAVRDDDPDVGLQVPELFEKCRIGRLFRLQHEQLFRFGGDFDWRSNQRGAGAALRCIGLCDDGDDVEPFTDQRAQ